MLTTAPPNWDELLPNIFTDPRFRKSKKSRRRWHAEINGTRVGIVVALRPVDYDNHGLNKEDIEQLLKLRRDGTFDAAFVVLASVGMYIGHRDAEELFETLKGVPFRTGGHGDYWLLPLDDVAEDDPRNW